MTSSEYGNTVSAPLTEKGSVRDRIAVLVDVALNNRKRVGLSSAGLICAAAFEGIGIMTLLPVLAVVLGNDMESLGGIGQYITKAIHAVGINPTLGSLLPLVLVLLVAKVLITFLINLWVRQTVEDVTASFRKQLLLKLLNARWQYHVTQPTGRLASAIGHETQRAGDLYRQLCGIISSCVQGLVYFVSALLISWEITVLAAVIGCFLLAAMIRLAAAIRSASQHRTALMASFNGRLIDCLHNLKSLKAMGATDHTSGLLRDEVYGLRRVVIQLAFFKLTMNAGQEIARAISVAGVVYYLLTYSGYSFESLMVVAVLFLRIIGVVNLFQKQWYIVAIQEVPYKFVKSIINEVNEQAENLETGKEPTLTHGIAFEDVSFIYDGTPVLNDLSLSIPVGKFTTIVGESGAGKTTVIDLVSGLISPTSGTILVDGTPLPELDRESWRRQIGYVSQDVFLFNDTLQSNITLGDSLLDTESVWHALGLVGLEEHVRNLPDGLSTFVGERGGRFSGGQCQRIALARALVRKPKLLILDEATSALDEETETFVAGIIARLLPETTVLAISHRPLLADTADMMYRLSANGIEMIESDRAVSLELQVGESA